MTLPTTTTLNGCDDDSDMFGPPRSSPPIGYRSRVPMISPKLRQREERKRILQLCAHKLERIKDSETNLRRSVCINNTYCRLTDELRREKQSRYLANLPKSDNLPETARDNIFNPYNSCGIDSSDHQPSNKINLYSCNSISNNCNDDDNNNKNINNDDNNNNNSNAVIGTTTLDDNDDHIDVVHNDDDDHDHNEDDKHKLIHQNSPTTTTNNNNNDDNNNNNNTNKNTNNNNIVDITSTSSSNSVTTISSTSGIITATTTAATTTNTTLSGSDTNTTYSASTNNNNNINNNNNNNNNNTNDFTSTPVQQSTMRQSSTSSPTCYKRHFHHHQSSNTLDTDLEILDRELSAINSPLLIDPEITQGAEQLEKALLSSTRKRGRVEDESDRLVREALSQFYIPPQRLISAIEDCPLDLMSANAIAMNSVNMTAANGMMNGFGLSGMMHMGHHHHHHHHNHQNNHNLGHQHKRARLELTDTNNMNHHHQHQHNINNNNNNMNINNNNNVVSDLELDFDMNPNQKDFEVIMDALRLGTPSPTSSNDSCGQAAMMLSESASVFHNLVVTSLET